MTQLFDGPRRHADLLTRLDQWWSYVDLGPDENDCWRWQGFKDADGHGRFTVPSPAAKDGRQKIRAHRYSYEVFIEPLAPRSPTSILCDNESCVNPTHLGLRISRKEIRRGAISPTGMLLLTERRKCLDENLKRCSNCKWFKPRTEFHKHACTRDGLTSWCKKCQLDSAPTVRRRREALNEGVDPYIDCTPKTCSRCKDEKPRRDFSIARRARDGLFEYCRRCASDLHSIKKYGLTLGQRQILLRLQGGCGICRGQDPCTKLGWPVDHDHVTGLIRGLLCRPCNLFLGHLESLAEFDFEAFSPAISSYLLNPPARLLLLHSA